MTTSGYPRTCVACQRIFTCASAFHTHLLGRRAQANEVHCRTDDQMRAIGMDQYADGAWHSRVSPTTKPKPRHVKPGRQRPFA